MFINASVLFGGKSEGGETWSVRHTSTHLSGVLVKTFAVVALAEASRHQTALVFLVTHAATTVAIAY